MLLGKQLNRFKCRDAIYIIKVKLRNKEMIKAKLFYNTHSSLLVSAITSKIRFKLFEERLNFATASEMDNGIAPLHAESTTYI